jgi:CheY-like chemotaxis protein
MIRILFFDDEASTPRTMRRAVHNLKNEWTMQFASSGVAAPEVLAKNPADVVVSDMRTRGMDGNSCGSDA